MCSTRTGKRVFEWHIPFRGLGILGSGWQRQRWFEPELKGSVRGLPIESSGMDGEFSMSSRDAALFLPPRVGGGGGEERSIRFSPYPEELRETRREEPEVEDKLRGERGSSSVRKRGIVATREPVIELIELE